MTAVDWAQIPGTTWYRPERAAAAADALAGAETASRAAQAVVDLRHAVSNDHQGSLYPAAVPAAGVFVQVILDKPGEPRTYALNALLDWWGCFRPETGYETYHDPVYGHIEVTEGILRQVREAAPALTRLAEDPAVANRGRISELLLWLERGWVTADD